LNDFGELIGSTRELVATERGIFRVSSGEQVAGFAAAWGLDFVPGRVVFSPDASVGLAAPEASDGQGKLCGVLGAHELTAVPSVAPWMGVALSQGARRVALHQAIYCVLATVVQRPRAGRTSTLRP
jgi:hypothetical protein